MTTAACASSSMYSKRNELNFWTSPN